MSNPRADVLRLFHDALAAVNGAACVRRFFAARTGPGAVYAVAIGKAAGAMLQGARAALGDDLRAGLLITKPGHVPPDLREDAAVTVLEAGHPVPDETSLRAGAALLDFIVSTPPDAHLLFLISGGASSLVEVLPPGLSLDDVRRLNAWLLGSGLDIHEMNALRKQFSCIKGGRLAQHLRGRRALQLLISDVPGDAPADIGSGLLVPPARAETITISSLPAWLSEMLRDAPPPAADAVRFAAVQTHIVANLAHALAAAAEAARALGYAVHTHAQPLRGDAAAQGRELAACLLRAAPGVHLWGGETTVVLPPRPGRGGRNQQLALAAAVVLAGHDRLCLLAAGSDGSDGPGEDAGALVDGGTLARGELDELDAAACLRRADAGGFLEASGDLISTGPTGTNVMDIAIGLKCE